METITELISKLQLDTVVPKIEEKDLIESSYILIRHAYSQYNYQAQLTTEQYGADSEELTKLKADPEFFDPVLHPIGVYQCEANQSHINEINFKVVFVSPMQRALQTCIHLFKNHPNKANIRFAVLPIVREVLETSNDIAIDVDELMVKYDTDKEICCGINFDFSYVLMYGRPRLWQIFTLANLEKQKELIKELVQDERGENVNYKEVILSRIISNQPRYETFKDLFERAKVIKEFMKEYITANPLEPDSQEKLGIITHSRCIQALTASGIREEDDTLLDASWFKNCEMRTFNNY